MGILVRPQPRRAVLLDQDLLNRWALLLGCGGMHVPLYFPGRHQQQHSTAGLPAPTATPRGAAGPGLATQASLVVGLWCVHVLPSALSRTGGASAAAHVRQSA